jgi:hypothetical protein
MLLIISRDIIDNRQGYLLIIGRDIIDHRQGYY